MSTFFNTMHDKNCGWCNRMIESGQEFARMKFMNTYHYFHRNHENPKEDCYGQFLLNHLRENSIQAT